MRPPHPTISIAIWAALLSAGGACDRSKSSGQDPPGPTSRAAQEPASKRPPAPRARTTAGEVIGVLDGGVVSYLGIPYAAPPVGDLRFRAPAPPVAWAEPRTTSDFGPKCVRAYAGKPTEGEEDCLTLNLWAPEGARDLPVMVWVHGGGFFYGSSSNPSYHGGPLAAKGGVVVVTFNYRLGTLGFLATKALAAESPDGSFGNYGIQDQIAALRWVHDNVAAFGGDPSNVTVFGESAGAESVCLLVQNPISQSLIKRGIVHSSAGCLPLPSGTKGAWVREAGFERGRGITDTVGCPADANQNQCLRQVPAGKLAEAILTKMQGFEHADVGPHADGVVVSETSLHDLAAPLPVELIVGTTGNEAGYFTDKAPIFTDAIYRMAVQRIGRTKREVDAMLRVYPTASHPSPKAAFDTLISDLGFTCPTLRLASRLARKGTRLFMYRFTHTLAGAYQSMGAFHSVELPFTFQTLDTFDPEYAPRPEDLAVAETMRAYWTSFAKSGTPAGSVTWPAYTANEHQVLELSSEPRVVDGIDGGRCARAVAAGLFPFGAEKPAR